VAPAFFIKSGIQPAYSANGVFYASLAPQGKKEKTSQRAEDPNHQFVTERRTVYRL
jgi:hypothetical protein